MRLVAEMGLVGLHRDARVCTARVYTADSLGRTLGRSLNQRRVHERAALHREGRARRAAGSSPPAAPPKGRAFRSSGGSARSVMVRRFHLKRQPAEATERQSVPHRLRRSRSGQRMPLLQKQDLEDRQRRTLGAPLTEAWIGASGASNADPPNAFSIRSRNPPSSRSRSPSHPRERLRQVAARYQRIILSSLTQRIKSTHFCKALAICLSIRGTELAACQAACREKERKFA
jgi:hypothetical protein